MPKVGVNKTKAKDKNGRVNLRLTSEQTKKLNVYIVEVVKKQGRFPPRIRQKIMRWAFDEWIEKHGAEYDVDWTERE